MPDIAFFSEWEWETLEILPTITVVSRNDKCECCGEHHNGVIISAGWLCGTVGLVFDFGNHE